MNDSDQIKTFFEKHSSQVDSYYSNAQKPFYRKILDRIFRSSIRRRLKLALEECQRNPQANVLDVGCGAGRLAVELAQTGAFRITGIDFSSSMIAMANEAARQNNCQEKCRFILRDFLETDLNEQFDVSVALGFFDYTRNPAEHLKKMKKVTKGKIIVSFPAKWRMRNIVRVIRLAVLSCPVNFYTPDKIRRIFDEAGVSRYAIKPLGRDYFVVADV